jgi:hypothetical protein
MLDTIERLPNSHRCRAVDDDLNTVERVGKRVLVAHVGNT